MSTTSSPLTSPGAQFPQGMGNFYQGGPGAAPSRDGARPFGLRFGRPRRSPREVEAGLSPSRYCPDRQVSVDPVTGASWRSSMPRAGSMDTTGPSSDGGPSTGGEEWKPDFTGDMA